MPSTSPLCSGLVERIGNKESFIRHKVLLNDKEHVIENTDFVKDHGEGLRKILSLLCDSEFGVIVAPEEIEAVGHRVVHGGEYFSTATLITEDTKAKIRELASLAPLHNPVNYKCIEFAESTFPMAKQIAVFDTAFHQTIPDKAFRYAIPAPLYEEQKIRVYGFHGTSHDYVSKKAMEWLRNPDAKLISIHLGNGCSITAIDSGKSIDTSMGFGPLSGLIMGTRSGDIDPSVLLHLMEQDGFSPEKLSQLLNKKSGLQGLAGSNDMRDVRAKAKTGDQHAELALKMYAYRIKKYIGAYIAILNGLDAIIFTAGVGENDAQMREDICAGLEYLNIRIDINKNTAKSSVIREINTDGETVKILVIPTDEELEIARQTFSITES